MCYSSGLNTSRADAQNTLANNPLEFNETVNGIKAKPVHKCLQDDGQHHCELAALLHQKKPNGTDTLVWV